MNTDIQRFLSLRVLTGPYAGAFRIAPAGRICWYFSNLALALLAKDPDIQPCVQPYIDLYLSKTDVYGVIKDVELDSAGNVIRLMDPDSHDSYTSTMLLLASTDPAWVAPRKQKLKDIAYAILATQQKPSGLVKVFRGGVPSPIGYLMDNCENYSGVLSFSRALAALGDPDAGYYQTLADGIRNGVQSLFDLNVGAWKWSDASGAEASWYPGLVANLFPIIHGVPAVDGNPRVTAQRYDLAMNYIERNTDWEHCPASPWGTSILAAIALGDRAGAAGRLRWIRTHVRPDPAKYTINEIAYYIAGQRAL